ncbi:MAG: iron ABC transporter permease [Aminobacterium sp.]|nr:iron ABC transporter permease [Aminobacterium sp.]MDD3425852.1 iron ABC transporter permease [Aminobacterium sp.]MDD3707341.1 iron ABC transporter permease [Aminobacterium sp.]MDD4228353.1 iron ABC transporter permease [Aminobacterium sp.]MDD4551824.1 iron ABC transporter permease [Aminobacterium sp.]
MHLEEGTLSPVYKEYQVKKRLWLGMGLVLLAVTVVMSISLGAVRIPPMDVLATLTGRGEMSKWRLIIWNVRLPQTLAALVAGAGLSVAGVVMQSILRNPLGSPFTLGISNAAAFGAALSVMVLGAGKMHSSQADAIAIFSPFAATGAAFLSSLIATGIIILLSRMRGASPESMALTGVALASLFTAATMLLQYFADDAQLAAMVFWTFGDVARAGWKELRIMSLFIGIVLIYFFIHRWDYNAIDAGEEAALGLGVQVQRIRLMGMLCASLVSAVIVAFVGVIGFVGLVCPHMVRLIIGDDHRFLIPGTAIFGALLLLGADTAARLILAPRILPVSVLTSFLGAPLFIWLVLRRGRS